VPTLNSEIIVALIGAFAAIMVSWINKPPRPPGPALPRRRKGRKGQLLLPSRRPSKERWAISTSPSFRKMWKIFHKLMREQRLVRLPPNVPDSAIKPPTAKRRP
jgi:hypothetical protein